jgi:asparagine synthase (glutamine-hydrolysing)
VCGICGLYYYQHTAEHVDEGVLVRMRDTMVHRGPDGDGLWISRDRRTGLRTPAPRHRRPELNAAQPMTNEDGTIWITYNGEIYNHLPLREELRRAGHQFRTDHSTPRSSSTRTSSGERSAAVPEGMFAIAIRTPRRRLFLARIGSASAALRRVPTGLRLFASEIKALSRIRRSAPRCRPPPCTITSRS